MKSKEDIGRQGGLSKRDVRGRLKNREGKKGKGESMKISEDTRELIN